MAMTNPEAVSFLDGIVPTPMSVVTIDLSKWEDFKAVVRPLLLAGPVEDGKFQKALEEMDKIADDTLGRP